MPNVDISPDTRYVYTKFYLSFSGNGSLGSPAMIPSVPNGGKIDFQVQAIAGYYSTIYQNGMPIHVFHGSRSHWSDIQTMNIPDGSVTIYPNTGTPPESSQEGPTPTISASQPPTVPEFPSWASLLLVTSMVAAAGLLVHCRKGKQWFSQENWTKK